MENSEELGRENNPESVKTDLSMKADIARMLIEQMDSQIRLLFSLSTAICGGIVVLFFQVVLHNRDPQKVTVCLNYEWVLIFTFIMEGVSIFLGYLSKGAITSATPAIYKLASSEIEDWATAKFRGSEMLRRLALYQFAFFLSGIVTILFVILVNINQI